MYIYIFFSFQTWQTAVWNLMRMVMAFPDTLSTTIRKDKRTMGLITKSLENGKILLKWMNDKWCGLRKLPSQQQVSSTYPNVKNLRGDPHLKSLHNLIYYSMGLSILGNGWVGDLAFGFYSHTNILSNFWPKSKILRIMLYNYSYFPLLPCTIYLWKKYLLLLLFTLGTSSTSTTVSSSESASETIWETSVSPNSITEVTAAIIPTLQIPRSTCSEPCKIGQIMLMNTVIPF